jgi:hypothetical protein
LLKQPILQLLDFDHGFFNLRVALDCARIPIAAERSRQPRTAAQRVVSATRAGGRRRPSRRRLTVGAPEGLDLITPGRAAALAVHVLTVLSMRGAVAGGLGLFELFRDTRRHADHIGARVILFPRSPAFTTAALLTLWVGVTLELVGLPPSAQRWLADGTLGLGAADVPLAALVGAALWFGHPPKERLQSREPLRAGVGVVAGLAALALWFPALDGVRGLFPAGCQAAAPFALALAALAAVVAIPWRQACAALFMLLIAATTGAAWLASLPIAAVLLSGVAWLVFLAAFGAPFRYRIPGLDPYYADPVLAGSSPPAANKALLDPVDVLEAWRKGLPAGDKPGLVLLAASGGAYRAAFWTALILDRLALQDPRAKDGAAKAGDALNGLIGSIRVISGASGGMVAGAYLAAREEPGGEARPLAALIEDDIAKAQGNRAVVVPRDSLSAIAWRMVRDLPHVLSPCSHAEERGRTLDAQWATLSRPFGKLSAQEKAGERPSLILSPVLIESGAPMFVSNLDLGAMRRPLPGAQPSAAPGGQRSEDRRSLELFAVFPEAHDALTVATAVRLSATFPYVSPAVSLPTRPGRRVVDAGYFDNYGIDVAVGLLTTPAVRDWVVGNCAGVLILATRAFATEGADEGANEGADGDRDERQGGAQSADPTPPDRFGDRVARLFWWIGSPFEGLFSARGSTQNYRNRELVRMAQQLYGHALRDREGGGDREGGDGASAEARGVDFLRIATFRCAAPGSMSWHLSDGDMEELRKAAAAQTAEGSPVFDQICAFWSGAPSSRAGAICARR